MLGYATYFTETCHFPRGYPDRIMNHPPVYVQRNEEKRVDTLASLDRWISWEDKLNSVHRMKIFRAFSLFYFLLF